MSSRRKSTPSYLPHKQSGRDRAVWTDAHGVRHQKLLPGEYDSPASRTAFTKLQLELATTPFQSGSATPPTVSVNEVLLALQWTPLSRPKSGDPSLLFRQAVLAPTPYTSAGVR